MYNRPSRVEFEEEAACLKAALRKEVGKPISVLYPTLTIRQAFEFWAKGTGSEGDPNVARTIEELSHNYNVDSPNDFRKWYPLRGHSFDIFYDDFVLYPIFVSLEDGTEGWIFRLTAHPGYGNPYLLAKYANRLQNAGVLFFLDEPEELRKAFGYWLREKRKDFKKS